MSEDNDPYPWLDEDDPRRNMTDRECLEKYIDLSDSDITEREKRNLYKVLYKCHGLNIRVFYFFIFLKHCK